MDKMKALNNENNVIKTQLGFGCGRLVGGSSFKDSAKLIETALSLGIQHFDVAPSYGFGTAEDVLGEVLAGDKNITIATKVGIARPSNAQSLSFLKKYLTPLVNSSTVIKSLALKTLSKRSQNNRGVFDIESFSASYEDSLRRLKRDYIDYLLLHEPTEKDITEELKKYCDTLLNKGNIGAIGVGFNDEIYTPEIDFGTVTQRNIGTLDNEKECTDCFSIVHGVMRYSQEQFPGYLNSPAVKKAFHEMGWKMNNTDIYGAAALGIALATNSHDVILVSFKGSKRMIETVKMAHDFSIILN